MIRVLGVKRIMILVFLLAINVAFAAGVYMYLTPEQSKKDRELRSLRGKISTLQSDISRLEVEFEQLADQQAEFERLKKNGFFSTQGRREAELIFEKIQKQAGVISAVASIKPGELVENEEADKANHIMLVSPIEVRLESLDDVDIFKYIYLVEKFFPGHVTIETVDLQRQAEVSGTVLRSIASGNNPELVSANLQMTWRTMIPKPDEQQEGRL